MTPAYNGKQTGTKLREISQSLAKSKEENRADCQKAESSYADVSASVDTPIALNS
jgi:hypothetical protein